MAMKPLVRGVLREAARFAPERAARSLSMRQARALRAPDGTLRATLSDVMLAADIVGGYHGLRDALPATFADPPPVDPSNLSTWTSSRIVNTGLNFLFEKRVMTPDEFRALRDLYRSAGFSIAGVTEYDMLDVARNSLLLSARRQYTNAQATDALQRALRRAGYDTLRPWHARLVAQMNFASAYGAGSWETLHDPRIAGIIPAYQYWTVGDDRVRDEHAAMHGYMAPRDAAIWREWWPPNGYHCRCWIRGVNARTWRALSARGRRRPWPELDGRRVHPDRGDGFSFRGNPRAYIEARARTAREGRAR